MVTGCGILTAPHQPVHVQVDRLANDSSPGIAEFSAPVGSIRSRRPSGIGFVGSSRSLLMRNWTRHLAGRAIAARCRQ